MTDIDVDHVNTRLKTLYHVWTTHYDNIDSFYLFMDKSLMDQTESPTNAFLTWLLQTPITGVLFCFSRSSLSIYSISKSKLDTLVALNQPDAEIPVSVQPFDKKDSEGAIRSIRDLLLKDGQNVAAAKTDIQKMDGSRLMKKMQKIFEEKISMSSQIDIDIVISHLLMTTPAPTAAAAQAAMTVFRTLHKQLVSNLESFQDRSDLVTHGQLMDQGLQQYADMEAESAGIVVQSGKQFALDAITTPDPSQTIAAQGPVILGAAAKQEEAYAAVARVVLLSAGPDLVSAARALQQVHKHLLGLLEPGVALREVRTQLVSWMARQEALREFLPNLSTSVGWGTGGRLVNSGAALTSEASESPIPANSRIIVWTAFQNVKADGKAAKGLLLGDTVLLTAPGQTVEVKTLTHPSSRDDPLLTSFLYLYDIEAPKEEEEDMEAVPTAKVQPRRSRMSGAAPLRSTNVGGRVLRDRSSHVVDTSERDRHQWQLGLQLRDKLLERLNAGDQQFREDDKVKEVGQSFADVRDYPSGVGFQGIHVDKYGSNTVFLPVNGRPIPFHISTIESAKVQKNDRKDNSGASYSSLRVSFVAPSSYQKRSDFPQLERFPNADYLRELVFTSPNFSILSTAQQEITDLKKACKTVHAAPSFSELVVADLQRLKRDSPDLVELGTRFPSSAALIMRPSLDTRKKNQGGILQCHRNGFRFTVPTTRRYYDILYSNVRAAFLQQASMSTEMAIFHLQMVAPVEVGTKKTDSITFACNFQKSLSISQRNRHSDDYEAQLERQNLLTMKAVNKQFRKFGSKLKVLLHKVESAQGASLFRVQKPIEEASFRGSISHLRVSTDIFPTTGNHVACLSAANTFVLTLEDVEFAVFERDQPGVLKTLDLTFVFKDLRRTPVTISQVASKKAQDLKDWLDQVPLKFFISNTSVNWTRFFKRYLISEEKYAAFIEEGGWFSFFREALEVEDAGSSAGDAEPSISEWVPSDASVASDESEASAGYQEDKDADVSESLQNIKSESEPEEEESLSFFDPEEEEEEEKRKRTARLQTGRRAASASRSRARGTTRARATPGRSAGRGRSSTARRGSATRGRAAPSSRRRMR
eukprot:gnl/Dysnectes_brevis/2648_a3203_1091.p1 GENE.gnl/Dysnectes_brevis/2648_a3203_1091~~gnl/Dysnectes_brevis/2648_a3203_1091.p1  ORF type:complete len:1097 (-),score=424.66 gnl/Dysnectes_brevis/2648_a3203_1091:55-3345(-)